ncbi:hypothetical protein N657DRAFT_649553, partial [Parathielavia appendiculata]
METNHPNLPERRPNPDQATTEPSRTVFQKFEPAQSHPFQAASTGRSRTKPQSPIGSWPKAAM